LAGYKFAISTYMKNNYQIAVIGLGYVGLPLAVEFARKYPVVGFDINQKRIDDLNKGIDFTLETTEEDLKRSLALFNTNLKEEGKGLVITNNIDNIRPCNVYIVTVPTPTDKHNHPDLSPLYKASETVGKVLKKGNIVVYESTVYPGVTEDECVPVLEKVSGLKFNVDFYAGYSPERINPGDKDHTLTKILKITSGSTPEVADVVDSLYKSIIVAGTHKASSIKVAEAAKVIENTQRDINIAFVNELSKIFRLMGIDTLEILAAAGTKWNFLRFSPGLVGGHCIGVDPHYLAQKAQEVGYHPEIILAGRRLNDSMGPYVAGEVVKLMIKKHIIVSKAKCLVLGFTFKENCPDIRNTRVIDIISELITYGIEPVIFDPWADKGEVVHEYGLDIENNISAIQDRKFEGAILAVAHKEFKGLDINGLLKPEGGVVFDVKGILNKDQIDGRL
jgi:UDP-N-acetyl-D-galactosamine dehydrogenase